MNVMYVSKSYQLQLVGLETVSSGLSRKGGIWRYKSNESVNNTNIYILGKT